jgi:hypothetical protein
MNANRTQQEHPHTEKDPQTAWLRCLSPLYPVLAIWGLKWLIDGALFAIEKYKDTSNMHTIAFTAAVALSAIAFCLQLLRGQRPIANQLDHMMKIALPLFLLAAASWWLIRIGAVSDAFVPVLHSLLVAVPLVAAGLFVSRPLAYLGLWLFLASTLMSAYYLGYTSVVLNGFGGLALVAAAWHLNGLRKQSLQEKVTLD